MRNYSFALTAALGVLLACSAQAAEKSRPAQGESSQPKDSPQTKKVWTNEDLDQLRSRGLISIVGQEASASSAPAAATSAPAEPAGPSYPVYETRLDDPQWYSDRAAALQAVLDDRMAALQQEQNALALAKDRITQPGVALDQPSIGVTPEAALEVFQSQVQEVQDQLDALSDLARQHNIPPGALRG